MSYLRALRPHQWLKNTLVFAPPLAAHALDTLSAAFLAFVAFSLVASSVYVVNDLIDIESDRAHPRKRRRPFAAAEIPIHHGVIIAVSLALAALALSLAVGTWMFIGVLGLYYLTTFAYSFWLKRKLILDVWTLAGLYTIRVIAGAAATGVPLSLWFLAFSMFLFLALAAVKRHAELIDLSKRNGTHASGRAYTIEDMPFFPAMSIAAGYCAVLVFALYVSSPEVSVRYSLPYGLWLICPLLLYWISRIVLLTHRGDMHDDPIVFAVRDRVSLVIAAACGVLIAVSALS